MTRKVPVAMRPHREAGHMIIETKRCPNCGARGEVNVREASARLWARGALLREAFPELSAGLREQILTGIHPECWDAYLGPEPSTLGDEDLNYGSPE
jgi:hypothetical protein